MENESPKILEKIEKRVCRKCKVEKPLTEFPRDKNYLPGNGYRTQCNKCRQAKMTDWKRRHPENIKASDKKLRDRGYYKNYYEKTKDLNVEEKKRRAKLYRKEHKEELKRKHKSWLAWMKIEDPEKYRAIRKARRDRMPQEKKVEIRKRRRDNMRRLRPERYKERQRRREQKWLAVPKNRLVKRVFTAFQRILKTPGASSTLVTSALGFTGDTIRAHFESRFLLGMSWENYGAWEIDHILPICSFTFSSIEDPEFKKCWVLSNLRPLWRGLNIKKGRNICT